MPPNGACVDSEARQWWKQLARNAPGLPSGHNVKGRTASAVVIVQTMLDISEGERFFGRLNVFLTRKLSKMLIF